MKNANPLFTVTWHSLEDCHAFASELSRVMETPITIRLDGTLGAGKTQFTKFLAQSLGADSTEVTSPTFVLIHRYDTSPVIYHLDAYRVGDEDEFVELGIEELFEEPAITIIEWGEKFVRALPRDHLAITIELENEDTRIVQLTGTGNRSNAVIEKLKAGRS